MRFAYLFFASLLLAGCVSLGTDPNNISGSHETHGSHNFPPKPSSHKIRVYGQAFENSFVIKNGPNHATYLSFEDFDAVFGPNTRAKHMEGYEPDVEYTTIGHLRVIGGPETTFEAVLENAKDRARKLGGDAILITGWGKSAVRSNKPTGPHSKRIRADVLLFPRP